MTNTKSTRKPAPVVKCPYCDWKGSARGIFTHVRLGHPNEGYVKPPVSKKVSIHPYACDGNNPSFMSGGGLTKEEQVLYKKMYNQVLDVVGNVDVRKEPNHPALQWTEEGIRQSLLRQIEKIRNSKGYPKGMNG